MLTAGTILWRRLDRPGHEAARVALVDSRWQMTGTTVILHEHEPCRLDYSLVCNAEWQTLSGKVKGWVGDDLVDLEISVDSARRWWLNGKECKHVEGCIDLDLNFSPLTNLLPIRRLNLKVEQEEVVRAAWLRFPSFQLEPLDQLYRRTGVSTYRYESGSGTFVADLELNELGLVTHYPKFCRVEDA